MSAESPVASTPQTEQQIKSGSRLPVGECDYCDSIGAGFGPNHGNNSSFCQSGKRPHCTCDWCF
jgi:hypothetical protein